MSTQLEAVKASNEISEPEYRIPTEGLEIEGAKIVRFRKMRERVKGDTYASWVVLAEREHDLHPFVVWNLIAGKSGFMYEGGDYYAERVEAEARYEKRAL